MVADKLGSAPQKVTQASGERWEGEGIKLLIISRALVEGRAK